MILAFPCMLTRIYLEARIPTLPKVDHYIEPRNTFDLGLIRDAQNLMARPKKEGTMMLAEILQNRDPSTTTAGFTDDTHIDIQ